MLHSLAFSAVRSAAGVDAHGSSASSGSRLRTLSGLKRAVPARTHDCFRAGVVHVNNSRIAVAVLQKFVAAFLAWTSCMACRCTGRHQKDVISAAPGWMSRRMEASGWGAACSSRDSHARTCPSAADRIWLPAICCVIDGSTH